MPIFIQFDQNGLQQAVINCQQAPGSDWVQAPKEFDWGCQYRLVNGEVVERTQEDLEAQQLSAAKEDAVANIASQLAAVLEQSPGLSRSEREIKGVLSRLAQNSSEELDALVGYLGETREDVMARCQADALAADRALLALEVAMHAAPAQLEACTTLTELEETYSSILETLTQQLIGGNHD